MMVIIPKAVLGMLEVIGYRDSDKTHCIEYDEVEVCYFDLTIDFLNGDILIL